MEFRGWKELRRSYEIQPTGRGHGMEKGWKERTEKKRTFVCAASVSHNAVLYSGYGTVRYTSDEYLGIRSSEKPEFRHWIIIIPTRLPLLLGSTVSPVLSRVVAEYANLPFGRTN
jgi:hypothetical protein